MPHSHNEWDPLKEVIVGAIEGATVPDEPQCMIQAVLPKSQWNFFKENAGKPFPPEQIEAAKSELDTFVNILAAEGVHVLRPDPSLAHFSQPIHHNGWQTRGGLYAAMPRDHLLVIGNHVIEAPMSWRSRYREGDAYRPLLESLQKKGYRWTQSPRPELMDDNYTPGWQYSEEEFHSVITEKEPLFDAADFLRLGTDILAQRSHVTNMKGIAWLQHQLGPNYKVHLVQFKDSHPMHSDATIAPLRPGLLLINPERVTDAMTAQLQKGLFRGWDFVKAPQPVIPDSHPLYMTSKWINMNILMLDTKRAIVEAQDEPMIRLFKQLGIEPIPCPFRNFNTFGGSFHCATADVHRVGPLASYLQI